MRDKSCSESMPSIRYYDAVECVGKWLFERHGMPVTWDSLKGVYHSWECLFGSTCGPFDGIGGQSMTTFRMEAWVFGELACVFCNGRVVKVTDSFKCDVSY